MSIVREGLPGHDLLTDARQVRHVVGGQRVQHQRADRFNVTGRQRNDGVHPRLCQVGNSYPGITGVRLALNPAALLEFGHHV